MATHHLDDEERELLEAYEKEDFSSDLTHHRRTALAQAARASTRKDRRMNIRISSRDMEALQRRALEEGLPYQSLVSSILHKYVSGSLRDVSTDKASRRTVTSEQR